MADITPSAVIFQQSIILAAGEKIQMQVLNADGSVKSTICADACPAGKSFTGQVTYGGSLA